MPWETKTVMEERAAFIEAVETGKETVSALCRQYGISRKTGYKWLKRHREGQQLCDQSRCPHRQPSKTDRATEAMIIAVRQTHPAWGGKKIRSVLESAGLEGLPSSKTCGNILKRNGLITAEESQKHRPYQRFEKAECNELWQADFKGDFLLGNGERCFPLDILDDHSRYCILTEPKRAASGVKDSFIAAFQCYGLPDAVLTDNGAQFSGFRGGYTQFERFLMDLDILPVHGRIMHPQTQGKIERFHRTMKQELLRTIPDDLEDAKRRFKEWQWLYNEVRPHSALGMKTPGSVYRPSSRSYAPPKTYVYDEGARLSKVNNWGYLRFGPISLFLSETMADTLLGIRPGENDTFLVFYRNFQIARIDAREKVLLDRHIRKL